MNKQQLTKELSEIEFALATIDPEHITGGMQCDAEDRIAEIREQLAEPCEHCGNTPDSGACFYCKID